MKKTRKRELASFIITNLFIGLIILAAHFTIGLRTYFLIQIPIMFIAGSIGEWLFFVQHQFQNTYWTYSKNWNMYKAAMEGSSYYKLKNCYSEIREL